MFWRKKADYDVLVQKIEAVYEMIYRKNKNMDELFEAIDKLNRRIDKISSNIEELDTKNDEIYGLRGQLQQSHEFVKNLVLTLIQDAPSKIAVAEPVQKIDMASYIAKKNGDATKPKLP